MAYGPVIVAETQAGRLRWLAIALPLQAVSVGLFGRARSLYPGDPSIRELVRQQGWRWQTTVLVAVLIALAAFIAVALVLDPVEPTQAQ